MTEQTQSVLEALRQATRGTRYEGALYLVGGFVRDKAMDLPSASDDIDLVLEGDALELARFLRSQGVADYEPVVYPRFGTAMIVVHGYDVELVTARLESYAPDSRKPDDVRPGTLAQDALRRDFTINTLLENLHTGEISDPTGKAFSDLNSQIIRTPTEPGLTFQDDPLRMLRAVRFAARFGFQIDPETWLAMSRQAERLQIVSKERIKDEWCKTLLTSRAPLGMELLWESNLLAQFAPELLEMVGVTQNKFHAYPVWEHTLAALGALPQDASLVLRLATLLHDIGKPRTRSVEEDGVHVHFYEHQNVGAEMARAILTRLKFSNEMIEAVVTLVAQHMRIGEYSSAWTDSAVRRLIRDLGPQTDDLFLLHRADVAALDANYRDISHAHQLRDRMQEILTQQDIHTLTSPLDGAEIMQILDLPPGRTVGRIKDYLTNEVIEGRLAPDDRLEAERLARRLNGEINKP